MRIGVPVERDDRERRVALTPDVVERLGSTGYTVVVESQAGAEAGFSDEDYRRAGAELGDPWEVDLVVKVAPPAPEELSSLRPGTALLGFLTPFEAPDLVAALADRHLSGFAFELMPRVTRAQPMDALSSQATAAGYQAVLEAAARLGKFFPMLTTAAGTVRPAAVLVIGAGVAGLQAIATARRLGAVVSAYDVRPAAAEQVESLGARFVDLAMLGEQDQAGYAKELAEDQQHQVLETLAPHVARADVVITTAQIPGKPAPLLLTRAMVEAMRPGSLVLDLAAPTGGNCELTVADEEVMHAGVRVLGPTDLAGRVASHASQMYARNVAAVVRHLAPRGELEIDLEDEIIGACCLTHRGKVVHPAFGGVAQPAPGGGVGR